MSKEPAGAGDDLERLMKELQSKGWSAGKLEGLRQRWEDICHDPMRRGRGGKGLPGNERPEPPPDPEPVPRPDIAALLHRTATWKAQPGAEEN